MSAGLGGYAPESGHFTLNPSLLRFRYWVVLLRNIVDFFIDNYWWVAILRNPICRQPF